MRGDGRLKKVFKVMWCNGVLQGKESDLENGRFLHNDKTPEGRNYFGMRSLVFSTYKTLSRMCFLFT
jgi:hypothetical protein